MKKLTSVLIFIYLLTNIARATSIIPFPNIGEMAKGAPFVVLVKALENTTTTKDKVTYYGTKVKVINALKGATNGQIMSIKEWKTTISDKYISVIAGDLHLEPGNEYLLFLEEKPDGFQPIMLAHGVYKHVFYENQHLMVPLEASGEIEDFERPDGIVAEPIVVHHLQPMIDMLKKVLVGKDDWNAAKSRYQNNFSDLNGPAEDRVAPSHCTFFNITLGGNTHNGRWIGFTTTPVFVRKNTVPDALCSTADMATNDAASDLTTNYTGINVAIGGNVTAGSCPITSNLSSFFAGFLSNPGPRNILVLYNDPCNDISDPVITATSFSGVLAVGGSYFTSSTNNFDGSVWFTSQYGFVIVNNGWGTTTASASFFCNAANYKSFMTHELTHALSINHIPDVSPGGAANMNPSCCTSITALDIACLNYLYPAAVVPIELTSFSGKSLTNGNQLLWSTQIESNNYGFHIEQSKDGLNFEEISFEKRRNNESQTKNYTFLDQHPYPNLTYYRLIQEDFDGKKEASPIISIQNKANSHVTIAPNPIENGLFNLQIYTEVSSEYSIELYNLQGQKLQNWKFLAEKGSNYLDCQLDNIPKGCYFLKTSGVYGENQVKKLIVK
jgi:hypothetical protein